MKVFVLPCHFEHFGSGKCALHILSGESRCASSTVPRQLRCCATHGALHQPGQLPPELRGETWQHCGCPASSDRNGWSGDVWSRARATTGATTGATVKLRQIRLGWCKKDPIIPRCEMTLLHVLPVLLYYTLIRRSSKCSRTYAVQLLARLCRLARVSCNSKQQPFSLSLK